MKYPEKKEWQEKRKHKDQEENLREREKIITYRKNIKVIEKEQIEIRKELDGERERERER